MSYYKHGLGTCKVSIWCTNSRKWVFNIRFKLNWIYLRKNCPRNFHGLYLEVQDMQCPITDSLTVCWLWFDTTPRKESDLSIFTKKEQQRIFIKTQILIKMTIMTIRVCKKKSCKIIFFYICLVFLVMLICLIFKKKV